MYELYCLGIPAYIDRQQNYQFINLTIRSQQMTHRFANVVPTETLGISPNLGFAGSGVYKPAIAESL
jgi:hypothetical protein